MCQCLVLANCNRNNNKKNTTTTKQHSFQWARMTCDGQGIRAYQTVMHGITLRPIDCTELPSGSADSLLFAKEFLEKPDTYSQTLIVWLFQEVLDSP